MTRWNLISWPLAMGAGMVLTACSGSGATGAQAASGMPDAQAQQASSGQAPRNQCNAQPAQFLVGQPYSAGTLEQAITLAERQLHTLRQKISQLESKLGELIRFGEENDVISGKVHRLAVALVIAESADEVRETLYRSLVDDFQVPHVTLRTWSELDEGDDDDEAERPAQGLDHHPRHRQDRRAIHLAREQQGRDAEGETERQHDEIGRALEHRLHLEDRARDQLSPAGLEAIGGRS